MAPCVGVDADAVVAYEAFCVGVDAADGDAIVAFGVLCIVEVAATVKSTAVSVVPADINLGLMALNASNLFHTN